MSSNSIHNSTAPANSLVNSTLHVVGIGASAGGLEALEAFFERMPPDSGAAFVVVQHLSPDFKSLMDELLRRHTSMTVHRVQDGMALEPNAVYLIPPKKEMIVSGRRLLLSDKAPGPGLTLPIDTFFRSLAHDVGEAAIGIVLSGTGSDGSRGIRDIHAAGGLVLVQDPDSARFDGMPRSAVDTGVVDHVLTPLEMPGRILRQLGQHPTPGAEGDNLLDGLPDSAVSSDVMVDVFRVLREQYGIDFSYYKPSTVTRRIERRLQMSRATDLREYTQQLRNDPGELNALYRDLLIGVTSFFRDQEAFHGLERDVLPQLIAQLPRDQELRVWVAGCASGEEAYSLAILVHQCLSTAKRPLNARIFATDVHPASLEVASLGIYSAASLRELSPQRLERYFTRIGPDYQVIAEVRKMIVFAPHNVVKDAPFTRLDLVTCRNLLIYLQPAAQKKALSLFHFGLRAGGVLFLGPSESPGELGDEFETLDAHWRMYRKRRDIRLPADMRLPLSVGYVAPVTPRPVGMTGASGPGALDLPLLRVYDALLEQYVPPSLLLNERHELVHAFGGASRFLAHRDGRTSTQILDLVDRDLKLALAGTLQRAAKEQREITYNGVRVATPTGEQQLQVTVRSIPVPGSASPHLLVSLQPAETHVPAKVDGAEAIDLQRVSREQLELLESELQYTKENLQATVEEMETTNEELQATNEELLASNEELQSTNEELHSVNEELYTVNAEYQRKIVELTELTDDVENLLRSTDVAVVFLDRELCIRKFTPRVARTFQVLPQDVGRPIESFTHNIDHATLLDDIKRVRDTAAPFEAIVRDRLGNWSLLRILPYFRKEQVGGVVLTLIDVSSLLQAEESLRLMSKVFMDSADPIVIEDDAGRIVDLNIEAERTFEWARDELLGQQSSALDAQAESSRNAAFRRDCLESDHIRNVETVLQARSGRTIPVLATWSRLKGELGQPTRIATIAKDISVQKAAEEEARQAVRRRDQFLAMLSHELRNPLSAVLNAARLAGRPDVDPESIEQACSVIQRQAQQMARLLDDLLDVSRVTQGKIAIRREPVDLTELVPEVVQAVRSLIDARNHTLHLEICPEPVRLLGDASRLLQIQENLLHNAAKYTPMGGEIWYRIDRDGDQAAIRIRDTGVGIPPEMGESVFDLFVQSNETLDRSDGGMGVGLTLVKTLVNLHSGTVSARSAGAGLGSEFIVTLPIMPDLPEPRDKRTSGSLKTDGRGRTVLIVEDNADSREMLRLLLKFSGFEVFVAEDGQMGLEAIQRHHPDVALVDIGLPGLDGYELARRVRNNQHNQDVYLIALTGYGRPEDRQAVLDAGFNVHIVKPPKHDELLRLISAVDQNSPESQAG